MFSFLTAPADLAVIETKRTEVTVTWKPSADEGQCNITSYLLVWNITMTETVSIDFNASDEITEYNYTITNLTSGGYYTISVQVFNIISSYSLLQVIAKY